MAIFTSPTTATDQGYKIQFVPTIIRPPLPAAAPPFSDPRGLLSPGLLPSQNLSYRVYNQVLISPNPGVQDILASSPFGLGLFASLPEVTINQVQARTAITLFNGHDVIDMPTDGLAYDGDALVLPQYVYRGLHAGATPFIGPNDDIALKSAISYAYKTPDNVLVGTKLSNHPPVDLSNVWNQFLIDTGSNKLIVKGKPKLVSYVAIDEPLFRDVVTIKCAVIAIGITSPAGGFQISTTSFDNKAIAQVMRFVFINVQKDPNGAPDFRWRLSESYGYKSSSKGATTPPDLMVGLGQADLAKAALADAAMHFAYNLNDDAPDTDVKTFNVPTKDAFTPLLAKAKMNSASPYFDPKFKAQIVDFKLGYGESGTQTDEISAAPTPNGAVVNASFDFSSPNYIVNLPNSGRLGFEYSVQSTGGLGAGGTQCIILAETVQASPGLGAAYDGCLGLASVFDLSTLGGAPTAVERIFDDESWVRSRIKPPASKLNEFLLGQSPQQSEGKAILLPAPKKLDATVADASVKLPAGALATAALCSVTPPSAGSSTDDSVISLFDGAALTTTPPNFEYFFQVFPSSSQTDATLLLDLPPMSFQGFKSATAKLKSVFGFKAGEQLLEAMPGDKKSSDPSEFLLANTEALTFPYTVGNLTACFSDGRGSTLLAYESSGRIDVAIRAGPSAPFAVVRNAVPRIADDFKTKSNRDVASIPQATLPFLVNDNQMGHYRLFYVYKSKLLVKTVTAETFDAQPTASKTRRYSVDAEKATALAIHKLGASVVFDSTGDQQGNSILVDLQFNTISAPPAAAAATTTTTSSTTKKPTPKPIVSYSAVEDLGGYLYAFIEAGDRIVVRKSINQGASWVDVLPTTFSFVPAIPNAPAPAAGTPNVDGNAPFVTYDEATNTFMMFFFYTGALLFMKIPAESLRDTPDKVAATLISLTRQVLIGRVTQDMLKRGIKAQQSVNDIKSGTTPPTLSPHRVAVVRTFQGYHRVFYKDDKQLLRSLITSNNGDLWLTENQAVGGKNGD